ncbi:hypothetical protein [Aliagarivorans marinus]|uniref:hypothetical protein n=1 Tax=Aliagarivorans marinus TaxID=561965 RepID=UPI000403FA5D|nr:hypothetical protein [Aliagarivorans marinus]
MKTCLVPLIAITLIACKSSDNSNDEVTPPPAIPPQIKNIEVTGDYYNVTASAECTNCNGEITYEWFYNGLSLGDGASLDIQPIFRDQSLHLKVTAYNEDLSEDSVVVARPNYATDFYLHSSGLVAKRLDGTYFGIGRGILRGVELDKLYPDTELLTIHSLNHTFLAEYEDGSTYAWGIDWNISEVEDELARGINYTTHNIFANAALMEDGSVVTWASGPMCGANGSDMFDELSSGVIDIFASRCQFAALKDDTSLVVWGYHLYDDVEELKSGVIKVVPYHWGFSIIRENGKAITLNLQNGIEVIRPEVDHVIDLQSTYGSHAALDVNGKVTVWGSNYDCDGDDISDVEDQLESGVVKLFSTFRSFAALKEDGSLVVWGSAAKFLDDEVRKELAHDVVDVLTSHNHMTVLKADGRMVTWQGHEAPDNVYHDTLTITSSPHSFAGVDHDGRVFTWGSTIGEGDDGKVEEGLKSGVANVISMPGRRSYDIGSDANYMFAIREDRKHITWGRELESERHYIESMLDYHWYLVEPGPYE